jgi:hypothetical protein
VPNPPTTEEILARLDAFSRRLHGSVEQATSLHAVFWRLNKAALKAKKRDKLWGPLAGTFNIIQHALLRELIIIIVRVLDKPRNLETSDKVSFVVIGRWLERGEVSQALIESARKRHGERWARRSAAIARHATFRSMSAMGRKQTFGRIRTLQYVDDYG